MPRAGPRKVQRYSLEFKRKAVKLSQLKGVEVQAVADALEIHPFMLSRCLAVHHATGHVDNAAHARAWAYIG